MKITNLLAELATCLPTQNNIDEKLKGQSNILRQAIESNDAQLIMTEISNKKFYSTEVKVTIYQ